MIQIGNLLIDPDNLDLISLFEKRDRENIKKLYVSLLFKSGATKHVSLDNIGLTYTEFIKRITKLQQQTEDKKLMKLILTLNGGTTSQTNIGQTEQV